MLLLLGWEAALPIFDETFGRLLALCLELRFEVGCCFPPAEDGVFKAEIIFPYELER